ncbi:tyrosine recombinase XerC [Nonomuraea sp. GTA35]|uniref:site-specific integrase n=1 Tax=Nonomuraea sp. GTA35 TaxID=1676746 RepID=UPI0035C23F5E
MTGNDPSQSHPPGPPNNPAGPSEPAGPDIRIAVAVERFLASLRTATTRHTYARTLTRLAALLGGRPVAELTCEDYAAVMDRWSEVAPATWNRHLSALVSFTTWAQHQDLLETNPARRLTQRTAVRRGDRALPAARLEALFADDRHALRERVLWRLLYETAARPRRSSPSTSGTSTWSTGAPASSPKAARSSTCTGPPPPPSSCPAC